jgi:hypothetical protein
MEFNALTGVLLFALYMALITGAFICGFIACDDSYDPYVRFICGFISLVIALWFIG